MTGSSRRNHVNTKKRIVCAKFQQDMGRKESSAGLTERESEEFDGKTKKPPHATTLIDNTVHPDSPSYDGGRNKRFSVWLIIDMLNEAGMFLAFVGVEANFMRTSVR
jgi:hypothetical protein